MEAEDVFSCANCKAASVRPGQFIDSATWVCSQECKDAVAERVKQYGVSPSPWTAWFDYDDDGAIYQAGVDSEHTVNVCMTTCEDIQVDDVATHNAIVIADTNLIAAAPTLLEACERIVEWIDAGCDPSKAIVRAVREAIASAKGGA